MLKLKLQSADNACKAMHKHLAYGTLDRLREDRGGKEGGGSWLMLAPPPWLPQMIKDIMSDTPLPDPRALSKQQACPPALRFHNPLQILPLPSRTYSVDTLAGIARQGKLGLCPFTLQNTSSVQATPRPHPKRGAYAYGG